VRAAFLLPRYWPTWIGLSVLRSIEILPFAVQYRLGCALGQIVQRLPLPYVRIARRNIDLCLPHLSARARARLVAEHCRSLAMGLCETAITWWSNSRRVRRLATVDGMSHLEAALAKGRGAIVIGGHFTTVEISTRILGTMIPLNVVFRPPKNALLAKIMHDSFCRHGKPIAYDDIRAMIKALRKNEAVWYASDQSYRNKGAAMVNFFGIPAATNTATSRLAGVSGAPVLPYFAERLPGTAGYRVSIGPALDDFPSPDPCRDTLRLNAILEAQILQAPDQYLWIHRRFKGLSADYPNYYGRDTRSAARESTSEPLA